MQQNINHSRAKYSTLYNLYHQEPLKGSYNSTSDEYECKTILNTLEQCWDYSTIGRIIEQHRGLQKSKIQIRNQNCNKNSEHRELQICKDRVTERKILNQHTKISKVSRLQKPRIQLLIPELDWNSSAKQRTIKLLELFQNITRSL